MPKPSIGPRITPIKVAPKGVWVKAHFYKDGPHHLAAAVYLVANGDMEVFHARVDLRPIAKLVAKYHYKVLHRNGGAPVVGGFPGSIGKFVSKIGKSAVVKAVANGVKDVVRSKVTGAAIGATAIAFPAVGVPAAAAYAAANAGLDMLDKAQKAKSDIKKLVATGNKVAAVALAKKAAPIVKKADQVKKSLVTMSAKAKKGDLEAKKGARIINIVAKTRANVAKKVAQAPKAVRSAVPPSGSIPGMVVSSTGKIGKGYFKKLSPKKGQLANALLIAAAKGKNKGAIQRGLFQRVAGELAVGYRGDRLGTDGLVEAFAQGVAQEDPQFGLEEIFGCGCQVGCDPNPHNPFSQVGAFR